MYPNLKLQMWQSGMRQNRLAQLLGIHESLLSKIVNGFREPSPTMRTRIAVALKTNEEWLFAPAPGTHVANNGSSTAPDSSPLETA